MTFVVKDNGSNDEEGESNDHIKRSPNEEHMYALLTGYHNVSNGFVFEDMDPHNIANELNLMRGTCFSGEDGR